MLNRANARMPIFTKDEDFIAFETVLQEAVARTGTRLLSYCLMGNHWHLAVWPQEDDELSRFVGWLTHSAGTLIASRPDPAMFIRADSNLFPFRSTIIF